MRLPVWFDLKFEKIRFEFEFKSNSNRIQINKIITKQIQIKFKQSKFVNSNSNLEKLKNLISINKHVRLFDLLKQKILNSNEM